MNYVWDFSAIFAYSHLWIRGIEITVLYAVATIAGGIVIGVFCGLALVAGRAWLTLPIKLYVQVFRCTPLLVQIIWFYYALPILIGFNLPAWFAAGFGLTLYMGAFCTEIFRGGIISIGKGQWMAARALGMTYWTMMRRIILPQASRRMVPPLVNQSVMQLKNTSLLYVVAVPDMMYTSSVITSETYRPLEVYTAVALLYLAILFPLTMIAKRLEARFDK